MMPARRNKRLRRKAELQARLEARADLALEVCCIPGCWRSPEARARRGLSLDHCRFHLQRRSRHGSFRQGTLTAATLEPYRAVAERFLKVHKADARVVAAVKRVAALLAFEGAWRHPAEVRSRFLSPHDKARAAIDRLSEREVPPERILAAYLAVTGAISDEAADGPYYEDDHNAFRRVQVAKAVFRLASGYHTSFHRYPRSSGRVLRKLGAVLEDTCGDFAEGVLPAIIALRAGDLAALVVKPPLNAELETSVIERCPLGCRERCLAPVPSSCAKCLADYP